VGLRPPPASELASASTWQTVDLTLWTGTVHGPGLDERPRGRRARVPRGGGRIELRGWPRRLLGAIWLRRVEEVERRVSRS